MEVAAGLFGAYEAISTIAEVGTVAGYAITRPTNQLKAKFTCVANTPAGSPDSLARAHHSLTLHDGDLYIFGGLTSMNPPQLAGNEMHILLLSNTGGLGTKYRAIPALGADNESAVPLARAGHTATLIDGKIYLYGGHSGGETPEAIQDNGRIWIFDPVTVKWSSISSETTQYPTLHSHAAAAHNNSIIFHGGYTSGSTSPSSSTWRFDIATRTWTELPVLSEIPDSPAIKGAPPNFTCVGDKLYLITGSSGLDSQIHVLDLAASSPEERYNWKIITFPTNPLTPGPRPRKGAAIIPVTNLIGRHYLILFLGAKSDAPATASHTSDAAGDSTTSDSKNEQNDAATFWSDCWSLQLPSSLPSPASIKDTARHELGLNSGSTQWAEVEILPPDEKDLLVDESSKEIGKLHPGPRGYFAYASVDRNKFVLWGGQDAQGRCLGDGWQVEIKT